MFMKKYYSTSDGDITLYKGDCLEIMPKLNIKFDCCITDPPYGTTACKWDSVIPFEPMWKELERLVKKEGAICLFGQEPFSSYLRISNIYMYKYDWVWNKIMPTGMTVCNKVPMKQHEIISVFYEKSGCYFPIKTKREIEINTKNWKQDKLNSENGKWDCHNSSLTKKIYSDKYPTSIININRASGECNNTCRLHPTQKPVELIEYLIKTYTNEGDIVLDFTAGSGTTGIACTNTKRKCVLIEKEEKYCDIIVKRLQDRENELKEMLF